MRRRAIHRAKPTVLAGLAFGLACDLPPATKHDESARVPNVVAISAGDESPADADGAARRRDDGSDDAAPRSERLPDDAAIRDALGIDDAAALTVTRWKSGGGYVVLAQPADLADGLRGHLAVLDGQRRLRASTALDLRDVCPGKADRCEKAWLDLAPYRIADDEVAVGLRVRVFSSAATGVGTDDKLLLYRITGDSLTRIARIHVASDWTRAKEDTVIIVSDRRHHGLYDLRQRGTNAWSFGVGEAREDGEDEVRITWEFDGEHYVIPPRPEAGPG